MKKTLALVAVLSFTLGVFAQSFTLSSGGAMNDDVIYNTYTSYTIDIVNVSGADLDCSWELHTYDIPSGWDYNLCDYGQCYFPPLPANAVMSTVGSGVTAYMKLSINPYEIDGTGRIKVYMHKTGDMGDGDTIQFNITAKAPVGIGTLDAEELIGVYPNPATSVINIHSYTAQGQLTVFNALGKEIYSEQAKRGVVSIYTGDLQRGIYFVRYQDGATLVTRKVVVR